MNLDLENYETGVKFAVKVVPGSSKNCAAGLLGDKLKIKIAAPPERSKANKELVRFLAEMFEVQKSDISITAGEHNANKEIHINGINAKAFAEKLDRMIK